MVILFAREIVATLMRCLACKHAVPMQTSLMAKMKSIVLPIVLCIVYVNGVLAPSSGSSLLLFMGMVLFVIFFIRGRYDNKVTALV
jgi:hypothetical protein